MTPEEMRHQVRQLALDYADARVAQVAALLTRAAEDELAVRSARCTEAWTSFCSGLYDLQLDVPQPSGRAVAG